VYEVDKAVKVRKTSFLNPDVSSLSQQALFLDRLKPSDIAHHDYILEGEDGRLLRRQVCTPGTRVILDDIVGQKHLVGQSKRLLALRSPHHQTIARQQ